MCDDYKAIINLTLILVSCHVGNQCYAYILTYGVRFWCRRVQSPRIYLLVVTSRLVRVVKHSICKLSVLPAYCINAVHPIQKKIAWGEGKAKHVVDSSDSLNAFSNLSIENVSRWLPRRIYRWSGAWTKKCSMLMNFIRVANVLRAINSIYWCFGNIQMNMIRCGHIADW